MIVRLKKSHFCSTVTIGPFNNSNATASCHRSDCAYSSIFRVDLVIDSDTFPTVLWGVCKSVRGGRQADRREAYSVRRA